MAIITVSSNTIGKTDNTHCADARLRRYAQPAGRCRHINVASTNGIGIRPGSNLCSGTCLAMLKSPGGNDINMAPSTSGQIDSRGNLIAADPRQPP